MAIPRPESLKVYPCKSTWHNYCFEFRCRDEGVIISLHLLERPYATDIITCSNCVTTKFLSH